MTIVVKTVAASFHVMIFRVEFDSAQGVVQNYADRFLNFFDPPPPWLTALLNKICDLYLVTLTFGDPPFPPPLLST